MRLACLLALAGAGAAVRAQTPAATEPTTGTTAATEPTSTTTTRFDLVVEPAEATVGDRVRIRLRPNDPKFPINHIEGVTFKPDPEIWQPDTPWRTDWTDNPSSRTWYAVLRPFELGELTIPATTVQYRADNGALAQAEATTATLTVHGIRPAGAQQVTLIPLRDPAPIQRDWAWLWWTLGGAAAAGLAAAWLVRRWRRRAGPHPVIVMQPELPPGLWALRELDLRSEPSVIHKGPAKVIFTLVSEVIRIYLGRRYHVPAIDLTTLELLHALHVVGVNDEVIRWVRDFLDECDTVKFTKIEPSRERWVTVWDDARLIVKMTTPPEELGEAASRVEEEAAG